MLLAFIGFAALSAGSIALMGICDDGTPYNCGNMGAFHR